MADPSVLLVEGPDDRHVITNLCRHYHVDVCTPYSSEGIRIKEKGGFENLRGTLDVELEASGLEYLGIIVDADTNLQGRWDSLRSKLSECGYTNLPRIPDPNGTVVQQTDKPVVGIWIMPDNTIDKGMLENFVSFLVEPDDSLWELAGNTLDQITDDQRPFPKDHRPKAHIHTWLAWQEEPGTPLGLAIRKKYLNAEAPHAQQLINWLRRLFP